MPTQLPNYYPNASEVANARTYHGPWTVLGNPHPDDPTATSFHSQISSVFKHPHKKELYIALADRWLPNLPHDAPNMMDQFAQYFGGDSGCAAPEASLIPAYPDTSIADYVWLPVRFDGQMAYMDWQDEWRIEDYD